MYENLPPELALGFLKGAPDRVAKAIRDSCEPGEYELRGSLMVRGSMIIAPPHTQRVKVAEPSDRLAIAALIRLTPSMRVEAITEAMSGAPLDGARALLEPALSPIRSESIREVRGSVRVNALIELL